MAIISEMEEARPSMVPFTASFDPSNPIAFLEKVLDVIGKESNFLKKDTAEKEIVAAVMAAKQRLREAEKKKLEKESVKSMEVEKPKKDSLKPTEVEKPKEESLMATDPMEIEKPKEEKESGPIGKSFVNLSCVWKLVCLVRLKFV